MQPFAITELLQFFDIIFSAQPARNMGASRELTALSRFMAKQGLPIRGFLFRSHDEEQEKGECNKTECSDELNSTEKTARMSVLGDDDKEYQEAIKAVKFGEEANNDVHYTLSRDDYMSAEMRAVWFQSAEFKAITHDCVKQIKKMEKGKALKDKKYCSRGLESHTRLASITKSLTRKPSILKVLRAQDEQRRSGIVDDEAISKAYQQTTSSSKLWAMNVGLRDRRAVEDDSSMFMVAES